MNYSKNYYRKETDTFLGIIIVIVNVSDYPLLRNNLKKTTNNTPKSLYWLLVVIGSEKNYKKDFCQINYFR